MVDHRPPAPLSREAASVLVREIAQDTARLILTPHFVTQCEARGIVFGEVPRVVQTGRMVEDPEVDEFDDHRCKLRKRVAGRLLSVVVSIHQ